MHPYPMQLIVLVMYLEHLDERYVEPILKKNSVKMNISLSSLNKPSTMAVFPTPYYEQEMRRIELNEE